jgi:proline dehydrogenase
MSFSRHRPVLGLKERLVLPLAKRWISGTNLESAVNDAKKANSRGIGVVVNFLGEDIKDPAAADANADEYIRLQQAIADSGIEGFPSVKLTQLGLGGDDSGMRSRLERIASNAGRLGQLLWLDMEGSAFAEATINTYLETHTTHPGLGVALQAYARRSESDLKTILDAKGRVRLVKGAYRENSDFVFPTRNEVRSNYIKLMETLFERGSGFAIGTHDSLLIEKARSLGDGKRVDFHFEMLKGIRDDLKDELVKSGSRVYEYLPYGDKWYAYSKRRISEHPSNIWLLLRSLV